MDVYKYFNSRDVAAHCKKLGHSFTGREKAYLIWQSDHHTLQQKIHAWETLIRTTPDEEHGDFADNRSLHHFLREYIARLRQFVGEFQRDTPEYVCCYERLYGDIPGRYMDESPLFTQYDRCVAAAKATALANRNIISFRVRKKPLNNPAADRMGDAVLYMTPQGDPTDVIVAPYYGQRDLLVMPFGFYGWFLEIPTPFKRGDIVTGSGSYGYRSGPAVVDKLPDQRGEDYLDMCARLVQWDAQQYPCCNEDICYLSLEYYHGELVAQERFLYTLHNYMQKELPVEDMLRSYTGMLFAFLEEKTADLYRGEAALVEPKVL